jgi:hypothetical protein
MPRPSSCRRHVVIALCALAATAVLTGCGTSEHDQVQAKVQQFLTATRKKDATTLCNQVLSPTLIEAYIQHGITCKQYWQIGLAHVTEPSLLIGKIDVHGGKASAIVLTGAKGQESALDAIELVKTGAGWRIESLGSVVKASKGQP